MASQSLQYYNQPEVEGIKSIMRNLPELDNLLSLQLQLAVHHHPLMPVHSLEEFVTYLLAIVILSHHNWQTKRGHSVTVIDSALFYNT